MGKPTGFLEFDRLGNSSVDPKERIKNFSEFHPPLVKAERQKQIVTRKCRALYELRRAVLSVG